MEEKDALATYTVYRNPADFPGRWVVRKFLWDKPTAWVHDAATLEEVRKFLPWGLVCMARHPGDNPCIHEVWL